MRKKVFWNGTSHPAVFSDVLLPALAYALGPILRPGSEGLVLDPFAGTGKIHELRASGFTTVGVELEPEWAELRAWTIVGDAIALPFAEETFDAICTSPCYGNRFADHHDAQDGSMRRSYKHDLGRDLHPNNAGQLHWHDGPRGDPYRALHAAAWLEALRVLRPGGRFVLNIKDHMRTIRKGETPVRQRVASWHLRILISLGLCLVRSDEILTPGMRAGANSSHILPSEMVYTLVKEAI